MGVNRVQASFPPIFNFHVSPIISFLPLCFMISQYIIYYYYAEAEKQNETSCVCHE
jgi:hypothetical protein